LDSFADLLVVGGRRSTNIFFRCFRRWLLRLFFLLLSALLFLALRVAFGHLAPPSSGVNRAIPGGGAEVTLALLLIDRPNRLAGLAATWLLPQPGDFEGLLRGLKELSADHLSSRTVTTAAIR
jgi:hypothetical protein